MSTIKRSNEDLLAPLSPGHGHGHGPGGIPAGAAASHLQVPPCQAGGQAPCGRTEPRCEGRDQDGRARLSAGAADPQLESFREAVLRRATERSARSRTASPRTPAKYAAESPRRRVAMSGLAALGVVVANGGGTPLSVEFTRAREARLRTLSVAPHQVAPAGAEHGAKHGGNRCTLVSRLRGVPAELPRSQSEHGAGSREPEPVLIKFGHPCGQSPVEVYWADFDGTPRLRERLLPTRVASALELSHTAHYWLLHHVHSGRTLLLRPGARTGARSGCQERRSLITWFVGGNRLSVGERVLAASQPVAAGLQQSQQRAPDLVVTIMDA